VEKQTTFPHRSHSPYCANKIKMKKSSDPKTTTIVYTKSLALPYQFAPPANTAPDAVKRRPGWWEGPGVFCLC
jgi:hypothetical protein